MLTGPSDRVSEYGMSMNKMFDYMASGHPTLSNIQTRNDIFEENGCGMVIEAGSPKAMADSILKFFEMRRSLRRYEDEICTDRLRPYCYQSY